MSVIGNVFEDIGKVIVGAGGILLDVVTLPFKTLAEAISYVTDKVGDGIEAAFDELGLDEVGDALDFIIDRAGDKVQGIIERSVEYFERLPARIERTADDLFDDDLWNNFGDWFAKNLINAAELSGVSEELEELADLVKFNTRGLSDTEKTLAKSVFGDAIDLDLVRIDEYSLGNLVNGNRPFVTFNTINSWGEMDAGTLIHELTHVWQYAEYGALYIPEALSAQWSDEGYDFGGIEALEAAKAEGKGLDSFNFEQQAEIIRAYYQLRESDGEVDGSSADDILHGNRLSLYAHFVKAASTLSSRQLVSTRLINDSIRGYSGDDKLYGYDGRDTLWGDNGDDILDGGPGNDHLRGGAGDDILYGDQGSDILSGETGDDVLAGGDGNDRLFGAAGDDILYGNSGNDHLQAGAGSDLLYGGLGDDWLSGGSGQDRMYGQAGNDTFVVDSRGDKVYESAAKGTDRVISHLESYTLGTHLENLSLAGYTARTGIGNSHDNYIKGNSGANTLKGEGGRDTLDGYGGNDWLHGGSGNDLLRGGDGNDTLIGHSGDDILHGNDGNDLIKGGAGRDTLTGGAGDDRLYADSDLLPVVYQNFSVLSGGSNFKLGGLGGTSFIKLPAPIPSPPLLPTNPAPIVAKPGDRLEGGAGSDTLVGASNDDTLLGGKGDDQLIGRDGNDILVGFGNEAGEKDSLTGGQGADTFVLGQAGGDFGYIPEVSHYYKETTIGISPYSPSTVDSYATVQDFRRHEGDKLQVHGQASDYRLLSQNVGGGSARDTIVYFAGSSDRLAVIEDVSVSLSSDFVFV